MDFYPHRIDIRRNLVYTSLPAINAWCQSVFGDDDDFRVFGPDRWRWVGPGLIGFVNEADALLFIMRWR